MRPGSVPYFKNGIESSGPYRRMETVMKARFRQSPAFLRAHARVKEEYANELKRTLVVLPCKGVCECGLMLTERDRNGGKATRTCPRCGRSGRF